MNNASAEAPRKPSRAWRWFKWLLKGLGLLVLALIVLVLLWYAYFDVKGSLAWRKARGQLQAQGFSLDPRTYLPPSVPDAENFAKLPVFELQPDPARPGGKLPLAFEAAFGQIENRLSYSQQEAEAQGQLLPYLGRSDSSEKIDLEKVRGRLASLCQANSPGVNLPPNASATDLFGHLCPTLAELRSENAARPLCRFDIEHRPGYDQDFKIVTNQLALAKILAYEEKLALLDHQPQTAIDDLDVGWKVVAGLAKEPALISGLMTLGVQAIQLEALREGLASHAWNDAQLDHLDDELGKIDMLAQSQSVLKGEFVVYIVPTMEHYAGSRELMMEDMRKVQADIKAVGQLTLQAMKSATKGSEFKDTKVEVDNEAEREFEIALWWAYWWPPNGTLKSLLADYAHGVLPLARDVLDPKVHRVYPEKYVVPPADGDGSQARAIANSIKKFAHAQALVDEARIACRLERYRLAHQQYPATLDELVPAYGADLPRDVTTGEPYRYQRQSDGYLLYSVGWNQKDDGGTTDKYTYTDSPDWVWPKVTSPK